jgi:hypothetical protein
MVASVRGRATISSVRLPRCQGGVRGIRIDRCVDRHSNVVKAATVAGHMTVHQLIPVSAVRYSKFVS